MWQHVQPSLSFCNPNGEPIKSVETPYTKTVESDVSLEK